MDLNLTLRPTLRVMKIVDGTTVDGPGFRTSVYFAGCEHACPDCHNPSTWSFEEGHEMTVSEIVEHIKENGEDATFTGGDPIYRAQALIPLAKELKKEGISIWCYTGFLYETLMRNAVARELLDYVDVLVDGPFISSLRDTSLRFRGSSNQRLIDLRLSSPGKVVLWESDF